jgi:antitoxin component YwqK of YwqJK toxin-antitoxin module
MNISKVQSSIILISIFYFSCTTPFNNDNNGTKIIHYPNSDKVCQKIEYKNGKKNGLFLEYYRNGNLKYKKKYLNDSLTDTACFYLKNGNISQLQILKNGLKIGCWKKFNDKGQMYSELNFNDDELNGPSNTYTYRTLKPLSLLNFKDGKFHGEQKKFHSNGKLKSICFFDEGVACLGTREWYENGEEIKQDVVINIQEKNTLSLNNELSYLISCSNPKNDDIIYLCGDKDKGINVNIAARVEKNDNSFEYKIIIPKRGYVLEKLKFALFRKTAMNNTFIKIFYINAAANNY